MKEDTIFWDVDTQYDFMQPEGKLYVPGAETIIPKVSEVRRFALEGGGERIIPNEFANSLIANPIIHWLQSLLCLP